MSSTSSATETIVTRQGRAGRRALLAAALAGAAVLVSGRAVLAHTPYRQWKIYRQRHLMIGASREDAATYPKAKEIQAFLETHLPEASARVARARTRRRLADLLKTDQIRIILLSIDDAIALGRGRPPFRSPVAVRTLWRFGDHAMVVRPSFPAAHAWILARTFEEHGADARRVLASYQRTPRSCSTKASASPATAAPCPHLPWTRSMRAAKARSTTDPHGSAWARCRN